MKRHRSDEEDFERGISHSREKQSPSNSSESSGDESHDVLPESSQFDLEHPDFRELSKQYPPLVSFLHDTGKGKVSIDWKDPSAVRELSKALLKVKFGVTIELPPSQLCPTVPSRFNYIKVINSLMALSSDKRIRSASSEDVSKPPLRGIDIGTGASVIYPLLGRAEFGWKFLATDIDSDSIKFAQRNVALNSWEDDIELRLSQKGKIFLDVIKPSEHFSFSMCNPPFFAAVGDKVENPKTTLEAKDNELATEGGEFAFISQMIEESLVLRDQIRWFTSLIGRKVNLKKLIAVLKEKKINNVRQFTLQQGRTSRWVLAWSFSHDGLEEKKHERILRTFQGKDEAVIAVPLEANSLLLDATEDLMRRLKWKVQKDSTTFKIKANLYQEGGESNRIEPSFPPKLRCTVTVDIVPSTPESSLIRAFMVSGDDLDAFTELAVALKENMSL